MSKTLTTSVVAVRFPPFRVWWTSPCDDLTSRLSGVVGPPGDYSIAFTAGVLPAVYDESTVHVLRLPRPLPSYFSDPLSLLAVMPAGNVAGLIDLEGARAEEFGGGNYDAEGGVGSGSKRIARLSEASLRTVRLPWGCRARLWAGRKVLAHWQVRSGCAAAYDRSVCNVFMLLILFRFGCLPQSVNVLGGDGSVAIFVKKCRSKWQVWSCRYCVGSNAIGACRLTRLPLPTSLLATTCNGRSRCVVVVRSGLCGAIPACRLCGVCRVSASRRCRLGAARVAFICCCLSCLLLSAMEESTYFSGRHHAVSL